MRLWATLKTVLNGSRTPGACSPSPWPLQTTTLGSLIVIHHFTWRNGKKTETGWGGGGVISDVIMGAMASQITSLTMLTQPFIRAQIKETIKLRVTGICAGNSPVNSPPHRWPVMNAENAPIWDVIMSRINRRWLPVDWLIEDWTNWPPLCKRYYQRQSTGRFSLFHCGFTDMFSSGNTWQEVDIASGNGLGFNIQQANTWLNDSSISKLIRVTKHRCVK